MPAQKRGRFVGSKNKTQGRLGKSKGSNAVRRAVNRQIPALKRIANGSHTLRGAWEESGGDPLQWRVAHDKGETVYTDVCAADETGVSGLSFGQCDFIDGRVPDAIGDLRSSLGSVSLEACFSLVALTAIDTMSGLCLFEDKPPAARIPSPAAFTLALENYRFRRRWASRRCWQCKKMVADTLPRFRCCGACREVWYCSTDCHRKSWLDGHRGACSEFRRRLRRICDVCGAFAGHDQPSFPVCGGCDARRYCGEACQIADWEAGHAQSCPGFDYRIDFGE